MKFILFLSVKMPWQIYENYYRCRALLWGKDIKIGHGEKKKNHIIDGNIT